MKNPFKRYKAKITIYLPLITEEEDPDLAEQEDFDIEDMTEHLREEYHMAAVTLPDGLKCQGLVDWDYSVDVDIEEVCQP